MTYFLLTRPVEDSQKMKDQIEKMGLKSLMDPLLEVRSSDIALDFQPYQSILLTSPKAVPFLPDTISPSLWCVGKATAKKCQDRGFEHVIYKQTVEELIEEILTYSSQEMGTCLYLRGKTVTTDLKGLLTTLGYSISETICYEAVPKDAFKPETVKTFQQNQIKYTGLFSVQSALAFLNNVQDQRLEEHLKNTTCIAYSPQISDALSALPFLKLICCPTPNMDSFWKVLKNCVS